jgi:protein AFG1
MSKSPLHAAYKKLLEKGRLTPNPSQAALVERLSRLQRSLADSNYEEGGLYIYGDVGTGKSRLADLFASTISPNISTRRIHFHEFMMDIHSRLHRARSVAGYTGDPLLQIGRDVRNESKVLCFDEFQVTDIADAMILKRLFGAIWDSGGVMVATSNRHPDSLYERGLNRPLFLPFIKELQKRCEVWKMEGKQDYRMATAGKETEVQRLTACRHQWCTAQASNDTRDDESRTACSGVHSQQQYEVNSTVYVQGALRGESRKCRLPRSVPNSKYTLCFWFTPVQRRRIRLCAALHHPDRPCLRVKNPHCLSLIHDAIQAVSEYSPEHTFSCDRATGKIGGDECKEGRRQQFEHDEHLHWGDGMECYRSACLAGEWWSGRDGCQVCNR